MALLNQAVQNHGQLVAFFETLRQGTAPATFNRQFLRDIDYTSSNHLQFITLLKGLGFLTTDGTPTERYRRFLDSTQWRSVLAEAVREAYSDIFVLRARPTASDKDVIAGKFKSSYNMSDVTADRAARTFLALVTLADPNTLFAESKAPTEKSLGRENPEAHSGPTNDGVGSTAPRGIRTPVTLSYNIQIHLPATKDVEVYNAIFKSLRSHILD